VQAVAGAMLLDVQVFRVIRRGPFFYRAKLAVDVDGAPTAYHPENTGISEPRRAVASTRRQSRSSSAPGSRARRSIASRAPPAMYARQPRLEQLYERADPLVRAIGRRFAAAAERGELRAGVDPARLGFAFLTSLLGLLLSSADEPRRRRLALAVLIDVFAAGASRRPSVPRRVRRRAGAAR